MRLRGRAGRCVVTTKRYRWECPLCERGRLLGARPRENATARYCLPCSEKTGALIPLRCPVLDKRRAKARSKAVARRAAVRERQRETESRAGIHVPTELARVWRVARRLHPRRLLREAPPALTLRRKDVDWEDAMGPTASYSGHANASQHRIVLSMSRGVTAGMVRELVVHEVSHFAERPTATRWSRGRRDIHSDTFWTVAAELAEAVYGVSMPVLTGRAYHRATQMREALEVVS